MKTLFITIISVILFSGCITIVEPPKEEPEVVEEPKVVSKVIKPWPEDKKNLHIAMYFARMAQDPNLRQRYQPPNLYNICKCVLNQMEKDFEYEKFLKEYDGSNLTPQNQQYIYGVTYNCSVDEVNKMKSQLPEFDLKKMAIKSEDIL